MDKGQGMIDRYIDNRQCCYDLIKTATGAAHVAQAAALLPFSTASLIWHWAIEAPWISDQFRPAAPRRQRPARLKGTSLVRLRLVLIGRFQAVRGRVLAVNPVGEGRNEVVLCLHRAFTSLAAMA